MNPLVFRLIAAVFTFRTPPDGMLDVPPIVAPVNTGFDNGANKFSAVCVAVEIGLAKSVVLSTLFNPTVVLVIPDTVPVNVGFASGANEANVVAKFVPFNVIVGVTIPPLAVNNPVIVSVPVFVKPNVISPPRGELERLMIPLKIFESEK